MIRINVLAGIVLVALRLAIGWHFFVEGAHKIQSHREGKTSTNTPWTGAAFFKEGIGPAAPAFRKQLHLDDEDSVARLTSTDGRLPAIVNTEWDDYFARFSAHYDLTEGQKADAAAKLADAKQKTGKWLAGQSTSEVKKTVTWGTETVPMTVPKRLDEYKSKAHEIDDAIARRLPTFNKDVEKAQLRSLKADANKILADLLGDLDTRSAEMKRSIAAVLTKEQSAKGPVSESATPTSIGYLDKATMWAHLILGACLLLGFMSRLASFLLALFLLNVTLIAPALPYAPMPPGSVGYYLYVNLYVIEMLALFSLALIPTGKWFGIDTLLSYFTQPRRRQPAPIADVLPRRTDSAALGNPRQKSGV